MFKYCLICKKKFFKLANESVKAWILRHKFCSKECQRKWQKTRIGWNKGLTIKNDPRIAKFVEAGRNARLGKPSWNKDKKLHYEVWNKGKKGLQVAWNKGKKRWWESPGEFKKGEHLEENHPQWKGLNASYSSIHSWVARHKGKPKKCEHCGNKDKQRYEWANIDGKYSRNLNDYIRLCKSCHTKYDIKRLTAIISA